MKKQLRVFHQPFRKAYRHRRSPQPLQMRNAKRREAKQEFRRQKTDRLLDGSMTKASINWSPEQLDRIWKNTAG